MSRKTSIFLKIVIAAFLVSSIVFPREKQDAAAFVIADSVFSTALNEYRSATVFLPPHYHHPYNRGHHYPVVYLLDGEQRGQLTHTINTFLTDTMRPAILEVIIVAIHQKDRTFELTPTPGRTFYDGTLLKADQKTGGAAVFHEFIVNELRPHIENRFRTNGYNALAGHSFGGLNALCALFTKTDFFDGYIAIDPSLWWDDNVLFRQSDSLLSMRSYNGKSLFLAIADNSRRPQTTIDVHQSVLEQFRDRVEQSCGNGLRLECRFYEGKDHSTAFMVAVQDGLTFLFSDPSFDRIDPQLTRQTVETIYTDISSRLNRETMPSNYRKMHYGDLCLRRNMPEQAKAFYEWALESLPENENLKKKHENAVRQTGALTR